MMHGRETFGAIELPGQLQTFNGAACLADSPVRRYGGVSYWPVCFGSNSTDPDHGAPECDCRPAVSMIVFRAPRTIAEKFLIGRKVQLK